MKEIERLCSFIVRDVLGVSDKTPSFKKIIFDKIIATTN